MAKGVEAARRGVTLNQSLAEAHNAVAMELLMASWDRAAAEREPLCALELTPRYIQARDWYALFYLQFSEGRLSEGVTQAKLAADSDPLSSYAHTVLGFTYNLAGKYDYGVKECERGVELDSEAYFARGRLLVALHVSGRVEDAVAVGELALAMSGRHSWSMAVLAVTLPDSGRPAESDAVYA